MSNQITRIYSAQLNSEDKVLGLPKLISIAIEHYKTTEEYINSDNKQWYEHCERHCLSEGLKHCFN